MLNTNPEGAKLLAMIQKFLFLKIKLINEKDQYNLQKKDGLYFPRLTEFTIENLNEYDAKIIVCIGL